MQFVQADSRPSGWQLCPIQLVPDPYTNNNGIIVGKSKLGKQGDYCVLG